MRKHPALLLRDVSKIYRLYDNITDQALDAFGLSWTRFWRKPSYREFPALNSVSLTVAPGERVGILGRNGAGKTTLLKLITGNFSPSSGSVLVNGTVQALMNVGLGFHPEFSGYDNIRSSLAYNGLTRKYLDEAIRDVIDFVELDEFLHQPMKTYSLGMQARVMFAAATAIKPDILIVDEVLSAGDAYFTAKSAERMKALANSGCTLLLVSHAMQQVLEFCDRAIWLEAGRVMKEGEALSVVKSYEAYVDQLRARSPVNDQRQPAIVEKQWFRDKVLRDVLQIAPSSSDGPAATNMTNGGLSRWSGEGKLRIQDLRVLNGAGQQVTEIEPSCELQIEMKLVAEAAGTFPCVIAILLFTKDGRPLSRHLSPMETYVMLLGDSIKKVLRYPRILLGNGEYIVSAAIFRNYDPKKPEDAKRYDLLSRSFGFKVVGENTLDPSVFHHPAEWV